MSERVVVVGGGVIGAFCAWELSLAGREVAVVDQGTLGGACSHGNCGYVCPSHVAPLPAPGAIRSALAAMLRPNSPFRIRPRLSPALWSWLWNFARRCNARDMRESASARHRLLQSSLRKYHELLADDEFAEQCEWERRGLLFVYESPHEFEAYASSAQWLREEFDLPATPYDSAALEALEPALKPGLGGAWLHELDCHLRPDRLMAGLKRRLEQRGVEIHERWQFASLRGDGRRAVAAVSSSGETVEGAAFVFAPGALAPLLQRELGCRIPIQPGKGYSITTAAPHHPPRLPMIFEEHRVAITPMRSGFRIGSTMEFAGYDPRIPQRRLKLLRDGARHYLHEPWGEPVEETWYGWRPMTWDGKPIIGPSPRWSNVWIAAGHNMLGLSMAPATGQLVAELLNGAEPHLDPTPYSPSRF